MAIQIFGTAKNFDTKKAQRWFSERRIPVQFVDLKEKEMSPGELDSVITGLLSLKKDDGTPLATSRAAAVTLLIDATSKEYSAIAYLDDNDKAQKLLENPQLMKQPVVRNGKFAATVGYCPEIWEAWNS